MHDDGHFDEHVAATYDDDPDMFDPAVVDPAIDVLARLAQGGSALEFAIGTGRIALPLAGRGVTVTGIDLSNAMLNRLRAKAGSEAIEITTGDMATTRVAGQFELVYLVFNTIMNLTTQAQQVACFRNAAAHLAPGGCFVIEVMIPRLRQLPPGERFVPFDLSPTHWGVDEYDTASQSLISHHMTAEGDRFERAALPCRYVWPAELDLMAELAGMYLRDRWADWRQEPFTHESTKHVSIWKKRSA